MVLLRKISGGRCQGKRLFVETEIFVYINGIPWGASTRHDFAVVYSTESDYFSSKIK